MRTFILSIVFVIFCGTLSAQSDSVARHPKYTGDSIVYVKSAAPKNLIYAEAGGNAFYGSINYARVFRSRIVSGALRVGYVPLANRGYAIPIEATALFHRKSAHKFEVGFGITPYSVVVHHRQSPGGYMLGYDDYNTREKSASGCIRFGYCYIPERAKNLMFRAAFTPIVGNFYKSENNELDDYPIIPWIGVSCGIAL